jgi:opacity protein-like surface antigen
MRYAMTFAKGAALLLLVFAMSAAQARAQNQTPANTASVAPVGWTDPATGLTWTMADNGSDVNWNQANAYCLNLRLGGYSDWRLPTIDELQGTYDPGIDVPGHLWKGEATTFHVKGNLKLSGGFQWSSTQKNAGQAWYIFLRNGKRYSIQLSDSYGWRALCVRR